MQHPRYRLDRAFYDQLLASKPRFKLVERFVMPPRSGKGFIVEKGQTFRVVEEEGPQIADVALYNSDNPGESFKSLRTFAVEGWFLKRFTRLWSEVPWFRPMATCIDETLDFTGRDDDFHHHLVASHCSPEVVEMRSGHTGLNALPSESAGGHRALRAYGGEYQGQPGRLPEVTPGYQNRYFLRVHQ